MVSHAGMMVNNSARDAQKLEWLMTTLLKFAVEYGMVETNPKLFEGLPW
jgi:hypothetical protein